MKTLEDYKSEIYLRRADPKLLSDEMLLDVWDMAGYDHDDYARKKDPAYRPILDYTEKRKETCRREILRRMSGR